MKAKKLTKKREWQKPTLEKIDLQTLKKKVLRVNHDSWHPCRV